MARLCGVLLLFYNYWVRTSYIYGLYKSLICIISYFETPELKFANKRSKVTVWPNLSTIVKISP